MEELNLRPIILRIKLNRKTSTVQNKKDYYEVGKYLIKGGKLETLCKQTKWAARRTYKYYDGVTWEGPTPRQLTKIKAADFENVLMGRERSRRGNLLEVMPTETRISRDERSHDTPEWGISPMDLLTGGLDTFLEEVCGIQEN